MVKTEKKETKLQTFEQIGIKAAGTISGIVVIKQVSKRLLPVKRIPTWM